MDDKPKNYKQPLQPIRKDKHGVIRFQRNEIVRFLLDWATPKGMSMNDLCRIPFSKQDWTQFAQLIGYSVSGWGDLSYVGDASWRQAHEAVEAYNAKKKKPNAK